MRIARLLFEILFCAFVARGASEHRRKILQKSAKIHSKSTQNQRKNDLGLVWAHKVVSGTRSRRLLDTQMTPQGRSRDAPGGRRAAKSRPNASPGSPRDAPRPSGTTPKMLVTSFASPNGIGSAGTCISLRSMRGSSEVRFSLVFTGFCRCRMLCAWSVRRMEKLRQNSRLELQNRGSGRPRGAQRSKFERKNGQLARKCTLEVPPGPPKFF